MTACQLAILAVGFVAVFGTEPTTPCEGRYEGDTCNAGEVSSVCCTTLGGQGYGSSGYAETKFCEHCDPTIENGEGMCQYHPERGQLSCWEEHWSTAYHTCIGREGYSCKFPAWVRENGEWSQENCTGVCDMHPERNLPYCIALSGRAGSECDGKSRGDTCGTPTAAQQSKVCNVPHAGGWLECGNDDHEAEAATVCDGKSPGQDCTFTVAASGYGPGGTIDGQCHQPANNPGLLCVDKATVQPADINSARSASAVSLLLLAAVIGSSAGSWCTFAK